MAHSIRRPLSSTLGIFDLTSHTSISISTPITRRCFSQHQPLRGLAKLSPEFQRLTKTHAPAIPPDPSAKVIGKVLTAKMLPNDLGLMQGTVIPPTGKNKPSPIFSPNDFLHLQFHLLRARFRNYVSLLVLKWSSPATAHWYEPTIKLRNSQAVPTAVALHRQMYASFAEGDRNTLRKICCDGVFETFAGRILQRAKGSRVQWELVQYNNKSKVVCHRAARMPITGTAVRQAVVRIDSTQKLTRWERRGGESVQVEGTGREKFVREYVVIQQLIRDWQPQEWRVWGTTQETPLEVIEQFEDS